MFDVCFDFASNAELDQKALEATLACMSDDELAALEDDLDFCNFAGVPSARVLDVLKDMVELDASWQRILERRVSPSVPAAF